MRTRAGRPSTCRLYVNGGFAAKSISERQYPTHDEPWSFAVSLDREFGAHGRTGSAWAVKEDAAAKCLDTVLEAEQAGAVGEVGAAGAVVADREAQDGVRGAGLDGDRDGRGARVLGRVGQRFRDDVV